MNGLYSWIESIILNSDRNSAETKTFVALYRKFISPSQLFFIWKQKLANINPSNVTHQENAMSFLIIWIGESYSIDFNKKQRLELLNLIPSLPAKQNELKLLLIRMGAKQLGFKTTERRLSVLTPKKLNSFGFTRSSSFDSNSFTKMKVLRPSTSINEEVLYITIFSKFSPEQVAEAMTIDASNSFRQLKAIELIQKSGWINSKETKKMDVSILEEMTFKFNEVSAWVTSSIVSEANHQPQKQVIEGMISIAKRCESLNNFDGCMAVLSGLNNFAVQRLKTSWGLISEKHRDDYQQLEELMNPVYNFRKYVEEITSRKGPSIPFIGLLLRDFTFISENSLMNGDNVNMEVFKMVEKRFKFVWERQIEQYELSNNYQVVLNFMKKANVIRSDEDLYQQSILSEPSHNDESIEDDLDNFETVSSSSGSTSSSIGSVTYAWSRNSDETAIAKKLKEPSTWRIKEKNPRVSAMILSSKNPPNSPDLTMSP
eukprot:TRINITY_DN6157_c0_g2_i2.p1 TRINITY_DN6157_c0_g2~~TRINITY_DN6157_c0_g2_i2.p1  ORF type:complete len:486 (-),score=147.32 TRINITY_DN6157_c0_g2_i2:1010-2467(-)